ncbi:hypothetical protein MTR_1g052035 [Medicago truncatula]|uniref:Uncharacterized protein n=1 Tax=Medicago truncatula TaxID=3880 RepID=A0A072VHM6_MEDTR|nr:hypothetical protein MTR_1g052035 [Medicago truncatula]
MASSSSVPETTMKEAPAYEIRGRTMSLEEWELNVQTANLVDFISLAFHGCELRRYYEAQDLMAYFNILNGPTYKNLVMHLWVRAQVYDRKAAQLEMDEKKRAPYNHLNMEKKLLLKIQNENLLPKGGGGDQPSLEHRVFLHYFITKEKENVPKHIFKHMIKELRESQENKRCWIPFGRLISEIFHQGGILKALKEVNTFTDEQLGTETGKLINGSTLWKMHPIKKEDYTKLCTDLNESNAVSNLMDDFPPICKQDPLDVRINFIMDHYEQTGQQIKLGDIPDTMYGGALCNTLIPTSKLIN